MCVGSLLSVGKRQIFSLKLKSCLFLFTAPSRHGRKRHCQLFWATYNGLGCDFRRFMSFIWKEIFEKLELKISQQLPIDYKLL